MELITKAPKGTVDIIPGESEKWSLVEAVMTDEAELNGFSEIRTPVFEHTELFLRSVGDTTDVVEKQMYTFEDKGGRSITLRPEGTAGAVRAMLENGLYNGGYPVKLYYKTSCYRYEKPQAGRLRELHQFGVEMFGTAEPAADAQVIAMAMSIFNRLGLADDIEVSINSIGCPNCRPAYQQHFKEYLNARREKLCKSCQERMDINPMRTLDCKVAACKEELKDAPVMMDHLCDECRAHFEALKGYLEAAGIRYTVDPRIVRGLDYYTKTVFEIITDTPNGELTVCGGGRYDGLVEEIGGPSIPAVGFGMGIERVLMLLDQQNSQKLAVEDERPQVFVACLNQSLSKNAFLLMEQFRRAGLRADMDHQGRSLKAQFKYADKLGAQYVAVLGDDEVAKGVVKLRNMQTRDEWESPLKTAPEDLKAHLEK